MKLIFKNLEELCSNIIDCPHSTPEWLRQGMPIIRNFNILNGRLDFSNLYYVDEKTYNNRIKRACPEYRDLIISREAPMGEICLVPDNFKCCLGQRLVLLKVNKEICYPEYLLYVIQSSFVKQQIKAIDATGSIVSNLNISDLKKISIPVPELLNDQIKIANELKNIDSKIECNYQIEKVLNHLMKDMYQYYFIQYNFKDLSGNPYFDNNGLMKWDEFLKRNIPFDWNLINISELFNFVNGVEPGSENYNSILKEETIPFFRVSDLEKGEPVFVDNNYSKTAMVKPNDILVSFDGTVGRVGYGYEGTYSTGLKKVVSKKQAISNGLIYVLFNSAEIKKTIEKYSTGTVIKHASNSIKYLNIPFNEEVFAEISNLIQPFYDKLVVVKLENQELEKMKGFLLPLLINGQAKI